MTYDVEVKYTRQYGWERVTTEDTRDGALQRKREYEENEPGYPVRIRARKGSE